MAWIKEITLDNGAKATYWELERVNYSRTATVTEVIYSGWVDADAFNNNLSPMTTESIYIAHNTNPQLAAAALAFGRTQVRAQDKFQGSTDA